MPRVILHKLCLKLCQNDVYHSAASQLSARLLKRLKDNPKSLEWKSPNNIRVFIFWRLHNSGSQFCVITLTLGEKHQ